MKTFSFFKIKNYFSGETNVVKDWELVLTAFVVFLVIILSADVYVFSIYQKELAREVAGGEVKMTTIDKASLQKVIDGLNIKEANFNKNLAAPKIEDPSI